MFKHPKWKVAKHRGVLYQDYRVDIKGNIWHFKKRKQCWKKLKTFNTNVPYPKISKFPINGYERPVDVHKIVCETYHNKDKCFQKLFGVDIWKKTPDRVKDVLTASSVLVVNHKDHNKQNFKPKNLEFITNIENSIAAKTHYGNFTFVKSR